ncbi:M3 family metallopeptidase [Curtobacterium flaccumfaciens pv. flaccumfaciens]|uniref:M3 family metallopeptidase n=1 Tax=Curtobacterium flaccumfaciens TaxID=2035 RepID=UPI001ADA556A|nr:M3 family metallopeptidase [Curtobacterium flaccumfaciens]MBO9046924.1 M3 family metallopeptidase [Curtobacterium flaccumfaciens pv. flaccumfaciens]MBO9058007.1 M3 family metallopeptidase [Curtobacterium flaccumfaciens pv. flaccumfaciens]QTR91779.1 M3 family metallopeptidase [Curtobacterium flaccumfaciens pv. flaccumfaciens]QVG67083.1 M3 family metallopeptidase [Curtobacterium flaccumfaciens pv. flaccumfaciens]
MATPFDVPSTLPYALPPFGDVRLEHYRPAFEAGMAEQRAEVEAIATDPHAPTVENTLVALERSGQLLTRVSHVFFTLSSADSTPELHDLEAEVSPLLAAHRDAITLDSRLYARVQEVLDGAEAAGLTGEALRLVERTHAEMTLAGAGLDDAGKERLTAINQELSTLTTTFERNLLEDTNDSAVHVTSEDELEGLDDGAKSAAAAAAADRGLDGWLVTLPLYTGHPWLSSLANRDLRERIMRASLARGRRGNQYDNREVLLRIVRLRAERAELLGFPNHAAVVTADETAKTPEAVDGLLSSLVGAAARNADDERAVRTRTVGFDIESWDWAYATEILRGAQFAADSTALRPYFEADRVLHDGVFHAAGALYGLSFTERPDLHGYNDEVRVFEVTGDDGEPVGLYLLDLYTRDGKRGGAWMNPVVEQSELLGTLPVVVNNLNVAKPSAGSPTLLIQDEVETLFHEFGHALHGLIARTTYPRFSGTNVERDFVEFPSQVNEMWLSWPSVLANYAKHHETGAPLPPELVLGLSESEGFNEGFGTTEYLAAALLDQAWHRLSAADAAAVTSVEDFERSALESAGIAVEAVPPRYSSTYFAHTFSGGYDAGYYGYIWSEVLDADTVEWFRDNGGLDREAGKRFAERLLGVGGAKDPLEAYRDFRGRDAEVGPLLRRRGLE